MPAPVMGGDRLPQLRNSHHRGVLVVAVHHRVGCGAPNILRAGIVGKALAEIDGVVVARELRHRLENRDRQVGKHLVHRSHGTVSRRSWSAIPRPSRPAFRPQDACHRQGRAACAASDAVTDRLPERQANTTCLPLGSGIALRIEARERDHDGAGIGLRGDFVRLADVDQKIASLGHALGYFFRRQIVYLLTHAFPPNDRHEQIRQRFRGLACRANLASQAAKIKRRQGCLMETRGVRP